MLVRRGEGRDGRRWERRIAWAKSKGEEGMGVQEERGDETKLEDRIIATKTVMSDFKRKHDFSNAWGTQQLVKQLL